MHTLLRTLVGKCPIAVDEATVDELEPKLADGVLADVRAQVDDMLEGGVPSVATLLVLEERVAAAVSRL